MQDGLDVTVTQQEELTVPLHFEGSSSSAAMTAKTGLFVVKPLKNAQYIL